MLLKIKYSIFCGFGWAGKLLKKINNKTVSIFKKIIFIQYYIFMQIIRLKLKISIKMFCKFFITI